MCVGASIVIARVWWGDETRPAQACGYACKPLWGSTDNGRVGSFNVSL